MNRATRIQKIEQIIKQDQPSEVHMIQWKENLVSMKAYDIPVECLVYNKYNGRILSRTKTLESQGRSIDVETPEGKATIERLLWESKEGRNENTMSDIDHKGQLKVGIITKDGIVIDGNRRVMLLNRLKKSYFRAIVLPVALEEAPIEIERLETTYQMGEDEKLGYNPIEKYLKANQLYKKLLELHSEKEAIEKIASWMSETPSQIEEYLDVVRVIDDYLDYLEYNGIYAMADTPNDGKEDLFLYLRKWLNTFEDKGSNKAFDGYTASDVDDLKSICFDYIRAKIGKSYDGKMFRTIADGQKKSHFFGTKEIWKSFRDIHFEKVAPAIEKIDSSFPIDYDSNNIEATLTDRDSKFRDVVLDDLNENIAKHVTDLRYTQAADKPLELVGNAKKALDAIDRRHSSFASPEVQEQIEVVGQTALDLLKNKSPDGVLSVVIHLLQSIRLNADADFKSLLEKVKEIERTAYKIEKDLKDYE